MGSASAGAGEEGSEVVSACVGGPVAVQWQVGDSWTVFVEYDGPSDGANDGTVEIAVTGEETLDGEECWRLEFSGGRDAPFAYGNSRYVLMVSKRDGQPVHAYLVTVHGFPVKQAGATARAGR